MQKDKDLYEILGIDSTAGKDTIKKAYKKLAAEYHPDKPGNESDEKFKEVKEAYDVLRNDCSRAFYDRTGHCNPSDLLQSLGSFSNELCIASPEFLTEGKTALHIIHRKLLKSKEKTTEILEASNKHLEKLQSSSRVYKNSKSFSSCSRCLCKSRKNTRIFKK